MKASLPGVGGIVDITETGSSLKANNLRVGGRAGLSLLCGGVGRLEQVGRR